MKVYVFLSEMAAKISYEQYQMKLRGQMPKDQKNTRIQEKLVRKAEPCAVPTSTEEWTKQRDAWLGGLKEKCFAGWPEPPEPLELKQIYSAEHRGVDLDAYEINSQPNVRLRLFLARRPHLKKPERIVLVVQNGEEWDKWIAGIRHAFADEVDSEAPERRPLFKTDPKQFGILRRTLATNN